VSRHIVQMATTSRDGLYVLCNDGTLWWWDGDSWQRWFAEIPQDEPARAASGGGR